MKPLHFATALLIVACGLVGITLSPRERPTAPFRPAGASGPPASGRSGAVSRMPRSMNPADEAGLTRGEAGSPRAMRTPFYVIEQDSPAITGDGRLIESIGIEMPRGTFLHVLEVDAVQPAWAAKTYGTARPEQKSLRLHIVRGNSDRISENHSLGWIKLTGFEPGPNDLGMVAIALRVADGNIVLGAIDVNTQRPVSVELIESPLTGSPDR